MADEGLITLTLKPVTVETVLRALNNSFEPYFHVRNSRDEILSQLTAKASPAPAIADQGSEQQPEE